MLDTHTSCTRSFEDYAHPGGGQTHVAMHTRVVGKHMWQCTPGWWANTRGDGRLHVQDTGLEVLRTSGAG